MSAGNALSEKLDVQALSLLQIRRVYSAQMTGDFPPDELKPLAIIEKALAEGNYCCYGAFCEGEIIAYAFFVQMERLALLDYYAVKREVRDRGIGGRFLKALMTDALRGMDCVLLEAEDPDRASNETDHSNRQRRIRFYLRNGLEDTGVRTCINGVPYRVLTLPVGREVSPQQVRQAYASLYHAMLPRKLYDEMVRL